MSWIKNVINKIRHSYYGIGKVSVFVVAVLLVWWQMPRTGKFKYEYQLSKPWQHETLYAPFDFPIYKSEATLWAENEAAVKQVLPIFVYDDAQTLAALNNLMTSFESAWKPFKSRNSWSDDKCIAPSSVDFDNNRYTVEQWTQMEKAGAVFLPASGCRLGNVLYYCQTKGYSYTSNRSTKSPSTSTNHYFFFGENGSPAISYDCDVSREDKYGRGVRLAMDW